jgi:hypothetical protein
VARSPKRFGYAEGNSNFEAEDSAERRDIVDVGDDPTPE